MPDRIIKESSCTSDTLNGISDFEERFWWRLVVNCDDYGRFDARPAVLKSRLFPLMDGKTNKNMADALRKLASVGLVKIYEVDGRPFLQVVKWDKHQRIRAKRSRYPSPNESVCCQLPSNDSICPRNPIQSESESEYEYNAPGENAGRKSTRHKYGQYQNVLLTDDDYETLQIEFPHDYSDRIERLSAYMASTGKKYKNHLATIRNWSRNDKPQSRDARKSAERRLDTDEMEAIRRMMEGDCNA